MDRRTLSNGIATGALLVAGAGAIAWAQREADTPLSVANGPMSLDPVLLDPVLLDGVTVPQHPQAVDDPSPASTLPPLGVALDLPEPAPKSPGADLFQRSLLFPADQPAEPAEATEIAATEDEAGVGAPIVPASGFKTSTVQAPLPLPPLPPHGGASEDPVTAEMTSPLADLAQLQGNPLQATIDQADTAEPVLDPDVLILPSVSIGGGFAASATESESVLSDAVVPEPVVPDLVGETPQTATAEEPPIFELTPLPMGSPLTGPREEWSDALADDDGTIRVTPPPMPEFRPLDETTDEAGLLPPLDAPLDVPSFGSELDEPDRVELDPGLDSSADLVPEVIEPNLPVSPGRGIPASGSWHGSVVMTPAVGDHMLAPYQHRLARFADEQVFDELSGPPVASPQILHAWWADAIVQPLRPSKPSLPVDVGTLTLRALEYSPDVLAFQLSPEIQRKAICEEQSAFDWTAFSEVTYDDVSDPVGNSLTVGPGQDRLLDTNTVMSGGVRRRNEIGGEFELSQRFGYQDSNSQFFVPTQQGTSRLTLSYTQPLLTQRGKTYQQSRTVLAMLETGATEDDAADRIQDHLLGVTEAYWDLYRARAAYLQSRNLLTEADRILATLEGRSEMDTVPRQLLRARSAVLLRRSNLTRAAMDIRNAESRLRLLVGAPQMTSGLPLELLPVEPPVVATFPISPSDAARTALAHRPDIRQAVKRVRSTGVRVGVSENELMPRLDFVFNGYVAGLEGQGQVGRSFGDQFSEGRPSFAAGFLFEIPLGNRAAKARHHRRQLEMVQATHELEAVVEGGLTEVELSLREAETSYREMVNRYESMSATGQEMDYLRDRWNLLPGGSSTTQLLEDLLDAQERLADDEAAFVNAQVNYVLSLASLRRAMGTLLEVTPAHCPPTPLAHDVAAPSPSDVVPPALSDANEEDAVSTVSHQSSGSNRGELQ